MVVGFDLDMTLIDARPGMVAVMRTLAEESGLPLDAEHFGANLGPPLDEVLRGFEAPEERIPALVARWRELYPRVVISATTPMPGAADALAAVHALGGRTMVVTGKHGPNASLHVEHFGWRVDVVVGGLWAAAKGDVLREHGAAVYVGDHEGDVLGAKAAGALAVAVPTGPCDADMLLAAGADVVLADLTEFPDWLKAFLAQS
ncbi:HAD family hydrolase [Actinokineospora guangxiensis]|uniref:HAD family hydrolase n=1 Tax=Actinokineospora guangxiensis TaxID=1490288 RepID=A0ABW0ELZ2_9PSEU